MPSPQQTKRDIEAILNKEGATITGYRKGAKHLKCDYTFDNQHFFTQTVPHGGVIDPRWYKNVAAEVRRTKRSLQGTPS